MVDAVEAYEACAEEFLERRDNSAVGERVVRQWAQALPESAEGLELACGGGYPITSTLDAAKLKLWAIESSQTLAELFRSRFPHIPVQCEKVQDSDFFNRSYDFCVAVGLVFLLNETEQKQLISKVHKCLVPGGRFLFTSPVETGNWQDINTGAICRSLGEAQYKAIFNAVGFRPLSGYIDRGKNNYYNLERIG